MSYRVLLVDDDPHIQTTNQAFLQRKGYQVFRADNGNDALAVATTAALDGIVLDVDMPGLDGISVCRRLREVSQVPILFLSAYDKADQRVQGLMAGGDDYMGKPYSLEELELRLRLRIEGHNRAQPNRVLHFDRLGIDLDLREVRYGEKAVALTTLEFDLLAFLAQNPNQVFSYEQLYNGVWKTPINQGLHNIQVCMARVRQKLEQLCPGMHYIQTVRRKGYRFRGGYSP